jgi:hypothetical protein
MQIATGSRIKVCPLTGSLEEKLLKRCYNWSKTDNFDPRNTDYVAPDFEGAVDSNTSWICQSSCFAITCLKQGRFSKVTSVLLPIHSIAIF